MIRNNYSYWLNIDGEDAQKATTMLKNDGTLVGGTHSPTHAEFHVADHLGTLEEWTDMEDTLLRISQACPKVVLSMLAINEDTEAEHRLVYAGGSCVKNSYSRQVGADDKCDRKTAKDIIEFLNEHHYNEAAALIKATFLETL